MKHVKLFEEFLNEERPEWHDSDAPDAEGRFAELSPKDLAAWLIKTRNKDLRKITGSLNQQIVFNRGEDTAYADKMEKTRQEVYKQLGREDLAESWRTNQYSPQAYAQKVASGAMTFQEAQEESKLPFTLLMQLVKKIDKNFKLTFETKSFQMFEVEKAKGDRGPIDNPDIEKALKTKAEESGIDIGLLRIVMRRGMDAWNRSHYEGATQEQWGYARVNGFIKKEKGTWGGADADVAKEVK
jgi:hypothetical protein